MSVEYGVYSPLYTEKHASLIRRDREEEIWEYWDVKSRTWMRFYISQWVVESNVSVFHSSLIETLFVYREQLAHYPELLQHLI